MHDDSDASRDDHRDDDHDARARRKPYPHDVATSREAKRALELGPSDKIRHGRLANGVSFFVSSSAKPAKHAALALVVDVGSIAECEHERGVAHVVEHLAFRATAGYEHFEIVNFLESVGCEFGACQNAYTSMDETVYELTVPTERSEVLGTSLAILSEFARAVRISDEDVDAERGAVLEEWRMGRDARGRAAEAYWKELMAGSLYAERSPIGTEEIIRQANPQVFRDFYAKWYRPERMAVIASGDFIDLDDVVHMIEHTFSDLSPAPGQPEKNPIVHRPLIASHTEPRVVCHVDRELRGTAVTVTFKYPSTPVSTPYGYYLKTIEDVYKAALDNRLYRMMREPRPPFFNAGSLIEDATRTTTLMSLQAECAENRAVDGLAAVLREVARIRLHGISEQELKIAKARMLAETEQLYAEREQTYCENLRDELVGHYLRGDMVIGAEEEASLAQACVERVTREDVHEYAKKLNVQNSCVIRVQEGHKRTSESQMYEVIDKIHREENNGEINMSEVFKIPDALMDGDDLVAGSITQTRFLSGLDMTEITLSNGMRVAIRVTDFLDDQVLIRGSARGGLSEVSQVDYIDARCSNMIAQELGIYGFRPDIFDGILAGKRAEVHANVSDMYYRSIRGEASPVDIEVALQCIHLLFAHDVGRANDPELLETLMQMQEEKIRNQSRDPDSNYSEVVRSLVYGRSYHGQRVTVQSLRKMNREKACAFFNACFLDPSEFTMIMVGAIDIESLIPLLEKYLASIPVANEDKLNAAFRNIQDQTKKLTPFPLKFPTHAIKRIVRAHMTEAFSKASITFPVRIANPDFAHGKPTLEGSMQLTMGKFNTVMTAAIIEKRLLALLRFKFGEIYTCEASASFNYQDPDVCGDTYRGDIMISFPCAPERGSELADLARQVVQELHENGPSEEDVNAVRECEIRDFEVSRAENSFWRDYIMGMYKSRLLRDVLGGDMDRLYEINEELRQQAIDSLSPDVVRCHLQTVMSMSNHVTVVLKPQRSLLKRVFVPSFETRGEVLYSMVYLSGIAFAASTIMARFSKRQ